MDISLLKERFKKSFKKYYEDGSLLSVYDQEKGIGLLFYPSGALEAVIPIKEGLPDGLMARFYEDGTLNWESCIKKGRLEGPTKEYDKDLKKNRALLTMAEYGGSFLYWRLFLLRRCLPRRRRGQAHTYLAVFPL